jgi:hypothetical protein
VIVPVISTLSRRTRKWVGTTNPGQPWRRLRPSCEPLGGGTPADRPVRPDSVVVAPEAVELDLELADARRRLLPGEPSLEGLVEALDLAAGLGVIRARVPVGDSERIELDLDRAPATPRRRGEHRSVIARQ